MYVDIGKLEPKWFIVTNPICLGKLHPYPLISRSSAEKTAAIENDYHNKAFDGLISEVVPLYAIPEQKKEDDLIDSIRGEPDCSEHGVPISKCDFKHRAQRRFDNVFGVGLILFSVLFLVLMVIFV